MYTLEICWILEYLSCSSHQPPSHPYPITRLPSPTFSATLNQGNLNDYSIWRKVLRNCSKLRMTMLRNSSLISLLTPCDRDGILLSFDWDSAYNNFIHIIFNHICYTTTLGNTSFWMSQHYQSIWYWLKYTNPDELIWYSCGCRKYY